MQHYYFQPLQPSRETPLAPAPPRLPTEQEAPAHVDYDHRPLRVGSLEHYYGPRRDDGQFHVH